MQKRIKAALIGALIGLSSLIPITAANAADSCVPDSIGASVFSVHPGQKVGFLSNGAALKSACTKDDLGVVQVTYGPRTVATYSSGYATSNTSSWKWKDFSYEDLIALMAEAKITDTIDAQSLFTFNFFRALNGGAKNAQGNLEIAADAKPLILAVVLDPTPAGQCHPDKATLANGPATVYKGSFTAQILNGVTTQTPCGDIDSGWLFIGYAPEGSKITSTYLAYQPEWKWGGGFDYDWFVGALANANPPVTTPPPAGSSVRMMFWRSTNSTNPPSLDEASLVPTVDFSTSLNPGAAPAQPKSVKTTITCVKGKVSKKVSGKNPKCPSGYKKK